VTFVFDQDTTVFVYQFCSGSLTISKDGQSQQHRFYCTYSITFFGEIDESFGLTHDFDLFVNIVDSSDKYDCGSCDRFEIFLVRSAAHNDERDFELITELDDFVGFSDKCHQSAYVDIVVEWVVLDRRYEAFFCDQRIFDLDIVHVI
jgi:hypothetical protein